MASSRYLKSKGKAVQSVSHRWFSEETSAGAASALMAAATSLELWSYQRREMSLLCTRYMTQRDLPATYGFAMSQRASNAAMTFRNAVFAPPVFNVIATAADVLSARIWKNRPFITITPNDGDFKARNAAKDLGAYVDGLFDKLGFWNILETVGIDCMTTGTGIVKISEGLDGEIKLTRVLDSEILINEVDAAYGDPRSLIQRVFLNREDLASAYKDDPEAVAAINSAACVFDGYSYSGSDSNNTDIIPLVEGWKLPLSDGTKGRHMLVVGNHALLDEKWTDKEFPFAVIRFKQLSFSWFGQGMAEQLLPIQRDINRLTATIQESQKRVAWPRVLIPSTAQVNPNSLYGPGIVSYHGQQPPSFVAPVANSPELYVYLETLIQRGFRRAGISEPAAAGAKPAGLNSGKALETWNQIDDARHIDLGQRLEDFVTCVAVKAIELASKLKPSVTTPGSRRQQIDWDEARFITNKFAIKAFPISRLSQTEAARQQQIDTWYANGVITKEQQLRLQQVPDTQGFVDLITASANDIQQTLDEIVQQQKYNPPDTAQDLKSALEAVQSRYLQEKTNKSPRKVLTLLLQWEQAVKDLISDASAPANDNGAPAQSPAGSVGLQAPATPPGGPAPPPAQVAPGQAPPAALAA